MRVTDVALLIAGVLALVPGIQASADAPPLPRVLILGDLVANQAAGQVAKALQGTAEVVAVAIEPGEVRNSRSVLADLDRLLGDSRWDVIHFNVGLGDVIHRAPGRTDFRDMAKQAGGVHATDPQDDERNLEALVKRLEATGARLVWASTTPIQSDRSGIFEPGSEIEYNAIAARVMVAHGVAVNDLHAFVLATLAEHSRDAPKPLGLRGPFDFNVSRTLKIPLHEPMAAHITEALVTRRP